MTPVYHHTASTDIRVSSFIDQYWHPRIIMPRSVLTPAYAPTSLSRPPSASPSSQPGTTLSCYAYHHPTHPKPPSLLHIATSTLVLSARYAATRRVPPAWLSSLSSLPSSSSPVTCDL
eukprot:2295298-Rhodomonas_salina.1